jgi:hypothetical protein
MSSVSNVASLAIVVSGLITMITLIAKSRRETRAIVRDEIRLFFERDEARRLIEDAVDHSELARKVDRLILLLCVNDEKLKHSKLCEGE